MYLSVEFGRVRFAPSRFKARESLSDEGNTYTIVRRVGDARSYGLSHG
jgi:hypothetical protein